MRLPAPGALGWLDGRMGGVETLGIPIADAAIHAGLGVFETLALDHGRALDLARHLARLQAGAARLGVPLPESAVLRAAIDEACRSEPATSAWLKVLATRGGRLIVVTGALDPAERGREVSAVLLSWRRDVRDPLLGVKATSRAAQQLGLEHARRRGADEGLWLNTRGRLSEGCASNLFVVQRGRIFTPAPGEGVLPGIVRECALCAAHAAGIPAHEGRVRLQRLRGAQEAFLTNSLCGVRPLVRVDGRNVGTGRGGPITRRIAGAVARMRDAGW